MRKAEAGAGKYKPAVERRLTTQRMKFNPKAKLNTSQIKDTRIPKGILKLLDTDNLDYSTHYGGKVPMGLQPYYKDNTNARKRLAQALSKDTPQETYGIKRRKT